MQLQLNTEYDPVIGKHWSEVDLQHLLARRLYALSCELHALHCGIPALTLFNLEALGYVVDLDTGEVRKGD